MKPVVFGLTMLLLAVFLSTAGCTNHKAEEEARQARQERDAALQREQQTQRDKDAAIQKVQRDKEAALQQAQRNGEAAQQAQRDKETADARAAAAAQIAKEQALPEVSLTLRWQKPDNGDSGYEAYIRNPYRDSVAVTFTVTRPSSGNSKTYKEIVLDGSEAVTLGERNGWAFITGDTLTVTQAGHKPGMWTTP